MTQLDDGGWVYLGFGDAIYQCCILCENFLHSLKDKSATIIDVPADEHFGYTISTYSRSIILKGIFFTSTASKELFLANLEALQDNGPFDVRIKKSSTEYTEWDGTYITMPCFFEDMPEIIKPYGGDCEFYVIEQLKLNQAGNLADTN